MRHLFYIDTDANLQDKQSLRYGITSMLGASVASLCQYYLQLPLPIFLMFVISSAIFGFFSYGNTLIKQTLTILLGISLGSVICFLGGVLAHNFILALIYLVLTTFVLYFYSTLSVASLFFTKFNLILLAFALLAFPETTVSFYANLMLAIFSGGVLVIIINSCLYFLGNSVPWRRPIRQWHQALFALLTSLSLKRDLPAGNRLLLIVKQIKPDLLSKNPELFLTVERTTHAMVKWLMEIQKNPYTLHAFLDDYCQFFTTVLEGLKSQNTSLILKADCDFTASMNQRKEAGFFAQLPYSVRASFAESFFLLNKFAKTLLNSLSCEAAQSGNQLESQASWLKSTWHALAAKRLFTVSWRLTLESKIALRAAATMGVAYVVAYFFLREYAAWVVLTSNLVIQTKKGDTIKKCMDRILGHAVGAAAVLVISFYVWPYFNTPFIWVPLLTGIAAYYFLKNYFIFGVFFMIALVYLYMSLSPVGVSQFPFVHFTLIRLTDITVGSFIALMAGLFVFPNVGLQPMYQPLAQLFERCGQYLLKLNVHTSAATDSIVFEERQQLLAGLLNNERLFKTLSFQPDRYRHNQQFHRRVLNKQALLIENIEALTRRMYLTENPFMLSPAFSKTITIYLSQLQRYLSYYARHLTTQLQHSDANLLSCIDPEAYGLSIELEKAVESAFVLSDAKKITYESLISYLGVIHTLRDINQILITP